MYIRKIRTKKRVTRMTPHRNHLKHQDQQDAVVAAIPHIQRRTLRTNPLTSPNSRVQVNHMIDGSSQMQAQVVSGMIHL
jgi:hypothetical protein